MKEFLGAVAVCGAWLLGSLWVADYIELRQEVAALRAETGHSQSAGMQSAQRRLEGESKSADWTTRILSALAAVTAILVYLETRDKARKELRAYLCIRDGSLYFLPNGVLRAHVEMFNAGKTPAADVSVFIHGEAALAGEKPSFEDRPFIPHRQPIAPGSQWTVGHEFISHSREENATIIAGLKLVYVWGHIKYLDLYGRERDLRFRFRNVVRELDQNGNTMRWFFYPEQEGNHTT